MGFRVLRGLAFTGFRGSGLGGYSLRVLPILSQYDRYRDTRTVCEITPLQSTDLYHSLHPKPFLFPRFGSECGFHGFSVQGSELRVMGSSSPKLGPKP